jgi:hypothetical protein
MQPQAVSRRFSPRRPGFKPGSGHVGFCDGQKWRWGRFSPRRTSVSHANLHSICFSTIIFTITRGWHSRPWVAAVPIASQTIINKNTKITRSDGTFRPVAGTNRELVKCGRNEYSSRNKHVFLFVFQWFNYLCSPKNRIYKPLFITTRFFLYWKIAGTRGTDKSLAS